MKNNFKQNKIDAIKQSITMWEYIKDNGCTYKSEYFTLNDITSVPNNFCYLCDFCYSCDICETSCSDCINWNKENSEYWVNCCNEKSAYYLYTGEKGVDAYEIAPDMLKVLKRELKRLTGKE